MAAQARKLSLSASLEWAEEAIKRHARVSDGDAAIEVLRFPSVFWVDRLVLVALGRSSWWKSCPCDRHRRGTLCYGMYPWARLLPRSPPVEVHDLSSRLGSSIMPKERWVASGDVGPVGTCRASWITPPFQIDSIRSDWKIKPVGTSFSIRSDRLAIYFPRPNL